MVIGLCGCVHGTSVEALYREAREIRSQFGATKAEMKRASGLLMKALGVSYEDLKYPSGIPTNVTAHPGVLRELALTLEVGRGVPRNELLAFQLMKRAAELGDPQAHGEMSVRFAFGFADEGNYKASKLSRFSQGDTAMSLLHLTFGAFGNDSISQMALGYRHMIGHGVPRNCPTAVAYYNAVAEKVIELAQQPGSFPVIDKTRLSLRGHHGLTRAKVEQWLQYYQYSADLGDIEAQTAVGRLFNFGSHGIRRDYSQARLYFQRAAESGDATAMGHLGHMYANGHGVEKNNATAIDWFRKASEQNDPNGHYGLGYMYLAGYGVEKNEKKAFHYFNKAAVQEHTESQFSLGVMHLKGVATRTSPIRAMAFFTAAAHGGHLLAMYNLAMMHVSGTGVDPNCQAAVKLLKDVAEHGPWCIALQNGHDAFQEGDYTHALLSYLRAAQMGLEYGQSNAAWMLEHGLGPGLISENIHIALGLYKWSAEQENTNSLLAVGDIFYYGRGIEKDWNRSSGVYQLAEKQKSSRAAFNLGFMYQYGAGLPKDHHLSKRYYDLAYSYNSDAFYACKLSLAYLSLHGWWENARSMFPSFAQSLVDGLFTCKYANGTYVPQGWWSGRRADRLRTPGKESIIEKVMDFMDLDTASELIQDFMDTVTSEDVGDLMESVFLAALIILFIAVYRRRMRNRNPRQANNRNPRNRQDPAPAVQQPAPPAAAPPLQQPPAQQPPHPAVVPEERPIEHPPPEASAPPEEGNVSNQTSTNTHPSTDNDAT